jgi:hypothetical protein
MQNQIISNLKTLPQKILIKNSNLTKPNLKISECFITECVNFDEYGILIDIGTEYIEKIKKHYYKVVQSQSNKSKKLDLVCKIPYSNIININWDGDNYDNCPHIICDFIGIDSTPYSEMFYAKEIKLKNGKCEFRKILSNYNVINPTMIKDIVKMYKAYNKSIIIDLQDQNYEGINEVYHYELQKEILNSQLEVNLRHGKVLSEKFGLTYHSAYNIDSLLCKLNKSNSIIVSDYFKNRK